MWAGASSAHSTAEGEFNQENGGWRLIFLSLSLSSVSFFPEEEKNPNNFVCESLLAEGAGLRSVHQAGTSHLARAMLPALTQPPLSSAPCPQCPPRCRWLCPTGSAASPGTSGAQRGRERCRFEVAWADRRGPWGHVLPVTLGRADFLAMGLFQRQRARAVSDKLPSVPVLPGEPHLGCPRICSCCRIQPSREAGG